VLMDCMTCLATYGNGPHPATKPIPVIPENQKITVVTTARSKEGRGGIARFINVEFPLRCIIVVFFILKQKIIVLGFVVQRTLNCL
jgi:hypothetical protein